MRIGNSRHEHQEYIMDEELRELEISICSEVLHNEAVHQDLQPLDVLLPDGYEYRVCEYSRSAEDIHAVLRLKNTTEDSARLWIKEFQEKTKTTLRCKKKHKAAGQKNVFHVQLRCHHNTSTRTHTADLRAGSKNTSCPATLTEIVKRVITSRKSRSSDIHAGLYPMIVKLAYNHNHPVLCSDTLKHRDVSEEVKNTFLKLYQANHSPSTALHVVLQGVQKNYGEPDGEGMLLHLEKIIDGYNNSEDMTAKMARVGDNQCIALCTKLMKRVHQNVRTKAFSVVQLVDFLFTRLENVYEQKLLDVANNRWKQAITSR
ncbi:hypothetical protein Pcinc_014111 [Petrolisthes cinctipes]|uniref:Uncharacterized protein n=1 Tax=Petrolisthes cinctipes TaxID=88211 RepID=A0AAE1KTL0_PETCI|nr:hypothetical protein Pcinc_014111 [Petrolisthes cinctipes]